MNARPHHQRLSTLLLLLALLAAQWGWLAHEHQAHDSGQVCEVCVSAASLGHALSGSAAPTFAKAATASPETTALYEHPSLAFHSPLLARAPPHPFTLSHSV